jgi:hypothetical protein
MILPQEIMKNLTAAAKQKRLSEAQIMVPRRVWRLLNL